MDIKLIHLIFLLLFLPSCVTRRQATRYAIQDLKERVISEEKKERLPKAWGNSWTEHWKDQYQRMRKYDQDINIDTEVVIRVIEQERLSRGLPKVE